MVSRANKTSLPSRAAAPIEAPIARRKLCHAVTERILARIRTGDYAPGTQLPSERQLMDLFGVGRPAVREALQALERMGVLHIVHGERARVRELSADAVLKPLAEAARHMLQASPGTLEHLKDARLMFEVAMVRIAAERASDEDLARIEAALEAHRASLRDLPTFLTRDMEFHRAIAQLTGNPIFVAVSQALFEWLERFHVELVRVPGAERLTIAEHTRIFKAIARRDPEGAARAMAAHLTRANKLYAVLSREGAA